jgi:ferredoxin-NADP reductase
MIFETHKKTQREVAKDTYEVMFARPEGFVFRSGQYTQVAIPRLTHHDPKGRSRQFPIASSPQNFTEVSVAFRNSFSGFKRTLLELPAGSPVILEQGAGSFVIPLLPTAPLVFVAGGIGITPFLSYIRTLAPETRLSTLILLLYYNQRTKTAAFLDEIKESIKHQQQFRMEEVYGRPKAELFAKYAINPNYARAVGEKF